MTTYDISRSNARHLAKLMELNDQPRRVWSDCQLAAEFQHLLTASVRFDLGTLDAKARERMKNLGWPESPSIKSFGDLFKHPDPPVELLMLTKRFAKVNRNHRDSFLPPEVASLLYFASIVLALTRCGQKITDLDDQALRGGINWAAARPWIDQQTRSLLQEGMEFLDNNSRKLA